ncbi:hypothetical protein [Candidatus Spongiihabitans sp.]|uniref:hypothetical protein n=1 Tax=Candidatus Spongiihabitans sp. TaxID=3101308 RepID=UPI003C6EB1A9
MICGFGDTGSLLARRVLLLISGLADILLEKLTAEPLLTDRVIKRFKRVSATASRICGT